jgi:hypothetical protein
MGARDQGATLGVMQYPGPGNSGPPTVLNPPVPRRNPLLALLGARPELAVTTTPDGGTVSEGDPNRGDILHNQRDLIPPNGAERMDLTQSRVPVVGDEIYGPLSRPASQQRAWFWDDWNQVANYQATNQGNHVVIVRVAPGSWRGSMPVGQPANEDRNLPPPWDEKLYIG